MLATFGSRLQDWARPVVDFALPPRCPGSGTIVDGDNRFCLGCWSTLRFIGPPWCAGCNTPFEFERPAESLCAQCLSEPPVHDGVKAAVQYGDVAKRVVLRLKYARRIGLARLAGRHMARHLPDDARDWTMIPVPLHRWRIWSRGFNQSMLIARELATISGAAIDCDSVVRLRNTKPLRGLRKADRVKMVCGAFAVTPGGRDQIARKSIVLIDDVYTSGATTAEIVKLLKRSGAKRVMVLWWARVLLD